MDGVWSTVGSANVDSLSLFGLYENNFEIYDGQLAGQMEAIFKKLIEYAISPLRPFG